MKTFKRIKVLSEEVSNFGGILQKKLVVADIGTDHGYLSESLSKNNCIEKIFATDISAKSLSKLEKLIEKENLKKIETRVGDGLLPIDFVDVAVIAGIGGFETIKMIENQNRNLDGKLKCRYFVLQPAQNIVELRKWLIKNKILVLKDFVIEDAGRFYPIVVIDLCSKAKLKNNLFNIWLGRDNSIQNEDFVLFLKETKISLEFLENLPKLRVFKDKVLREKLKLFHLVEKLLEKC